MTREWDERAQGRLDAMLDDRCRMIRSAPKGTAFDALRSAGVAIGDKGVGGFPDLPAWVLQDVRTELLAAWLERQDGKERPRGERLIEDSLAYGMKQAEGRQWHRPRSEPLRPGPAAARAAQPPMGRRRVRPTAAQWLRRHLADGIPRDVEMVVKEAAAEGAGKRRSVFMAAKEIGVIKEKGDRPRTVTWRLEVDQVQEGSNSVVTTKPQPKAEVLETVVTAGSALSLDGNCEVTASALLVSRPPDPSACRDCGTPILFDALCPDCERSSKGGRGEQRVH